MKGKTKTWPLFAGRLLAAVFLTLVTAQANADKPRFGDTFELKLGGMTYAADAKFRSTREGNEEVELDLDDLNMDNDSTNIWLGFNWQFADNWGLSASYSSYEGDGIATAGTDGNYEDVEWEVNATLESELDLEFYIINLGWDFINNGRSHFGVGLGLHIIDMKSGIAATIDVDVNGDPITPIDLGASSSSVTAPLPNVHIRGGHRFGDNWYLGGSIGYFGLKVDDIEGELWTAEGFAEWRPGGGSFGVGVGYRWQDIEVEEELASRSTELNMSGDGVFLFVGLGF